MDWLTPPRAPSWTAFGQMARRADRPAASEHERRCRFAGQAEEPQRHLGGVVDQGGAADTSGGAQGGCHNQRRASFRCWAVGQTQGDGGSDSDGKVCGEEYQDPVVEAGFGERPWQGQAEEDQPDQREHVKLADGSATSACALLAAQVKVFQQPTTPPATQQVTQRAFMVVCRGPLEEERRR